MAKLKLPHRTVDRSRADELPPALRWDAPPPVAESALVLLGRRDFLKAFAVLLAALATPITGARRAFAVARGRFFTRPERATLEALCDRIIPPDTGPDGQPSPGGRELGAAHYIETFLTAFDHRVPLIYAGGPFSGRMPFPDNRRGVPSRRRPRNSFRRFIRLSRVQDIAWRAEVFGSASPQAPGADFADAARGALTGLRDVYRSGLAKVDQVAIAKKGAPFAQLSTPDQDTVFGLLDAAFAGDPTREGRSFVDILIAHTIEGCFGVPEYGGNRKLAGWRMVGLEGDNQPLGYSIFSTDENKYNELSGHPMTTPNPDEVVNGVLTPRPISAAGTSVQARIAQLANALSGAE